MGMIWRRPTLSLFLLSLLCSGFFSFVLFPKLVDALQVHYMRADGYYDIAENLLAGKGFYIGNEPRFDRGAFKREPIYPLLMAATLALPFFPMSLIILHLLFQAGAVCLAFTIFRDYGKVSKEVAYAAAAVFAVFPFSYWYVAKPTPENITTLFLLVNVWLAQRYFSQERGHMLFLWAASCGLCTLSKSNLVLLFPIGMVFVWLTRIWSFRLAAWSVLSAAIFILTLTPWIARNHRLSGQVIWGSTMLGTSFFVGNTNASLMTLKNLGTHLKGEEAMSSEWKKVYAEKLNALPSGTQPDKYRLEAEVDGEFHKRVRPWIAAHPALFVKKILINLPTLWFITHERAKSLLVFFFQGPLMLFGCWGLWSAFRRGWSIFEWQVIVLMSAVYAIHSAVLADARYFHVFLPFVCYFFCIGFAAACRKFLPAEQA